MGSTVGGMNASIRVCYLVLFGVVLATGQIPAEPPASKVDGHSVDEGDTALMSLDPREDGWTTEHLQAVAGARLGLAVHLLDAAGQTNTVGALTIEHETFHTSGLLPQPRAISVRPHANVVRGGAQEEPATDAARRTLSEALVELDAWLGAAGQGHSKVKVIRIEPHADDRFSTWQLVSVSRQGPSQTLEYNATWRAVWDDIRATDPKLLELAVDEWESVHTPRPWFRDQHATILASAPHAHQQFSVGIDAWVRRLDAYQHVMQYGHNGLAIGDANGDGWDDIYRCQTGGLPNRLLLADGRGGVRDASAAAGVDFLDNTRSALLIDIDNDGDQDLVLTLPSAIVFLENLGDARFRKRTQVPAHHAFSLAAADFDRDGDLDIFACVYFAQGRKAAELPVPSPVYDATNGGRNRLLQNDGDWKFADVTQSRGLDTDNSRFSYAAIWEDADNDGWLDLFVANDFGRCQLYRNRQGNFEEVSADVGLEDNAFGMSASCADYDRDGWMDYYQANMYSSAGNRVTHQPQFMNDASDRIRKLMQGLAQGNRLFHNRRGTFDNVTEATRVAMGRWSWGSLFADFDNDGWEDLIVANGFITGPQKDDL